jgi:hypothetical protein
MNISTIMKDIKTLLDPSKGVGMEINTSRMQDKIITERYSTVLLKMWQSSKLP